MTMSTRRNWLLQQMGITQYQLRRPRVLQGEVALSFPPDIRLLIISPEPFSTEEPLAADVLRALGIASRQVFIITPAQLRMLPELPCCASWCLGVTVMPDHQGPQLITPSLTTLCCDASAKRALWQQICNYDNDFFPDRIRP